MRDWLLVIVLLAGALGAAWFLYPQFGMLTHVASPPSAVAANPVEHKPANLKQIQSSAKHSKPGSQDAADSHSDDVTVVDVPYGDEPLPVVPDYKAISELKAAGIGPRSTVFSGIPISG
jgi:hypothetical protein